MVARGEETSAVHGSGEPVETKLHRIAEKSRKDKEPGFKFTSLYHLMNEELLRGCFKRLRNDAAAGIDKKAGVAEDGSVTVSDEGTPQGGVISPLLANIYLHYALDLWFEKFYLKIRTGYARLIRYADDFVACFQYKPDAEQFREELGKRLGKFGLEAEPTKTMAFPEGIHSSNSGQGNNVQRSLAYAPKEVGMISVPT